MFRRKELFFVYFLFFILLVEGWSWRELSSRPTRTFNKVKARLARERVRREDPFQFDGYKTGSWLIQLQEGQDPEQVASTLGLQYQYSLNISNIHVFENIKRYSDEKLQQLFPSTSAVWMEPEVVRKIEKRFPFSDPLFINQWHLQNTGQGGGTVGVDSNVVPAWTKGYTGNGVQICIVDDGVEYTHADLSPRYQAADSFDFNGGDPNPIPEGGPDGDNHGTACAGVALAADDGTKCGVGAAYRARLSAVRAIGVTGNPLSALGISQAITYRNQNNMIYSNSWGIPACFVSQSELICRLVSITSVQESYLEESSKKGRGGKGNIWVFAAGNSRGELSDVNYQDFPRMKYTIAVAAYTNQGVVSSYSDPGAALFVAAPSNGGTRGITTSDRTAPNGYNSVSDCTNNFGGTSSATPLVAGVIALMLQANPDLTWRDVMDIIAHTSRKINPNSQEWQTNGAGLHVSHDFGFGGIDADAAVSAAAERKDHLNCPSSRTSDLKTVNMAIPDNNPTGIVSTLSVNLDGKIEQTFITVNIDHTFRGDLLIALESPSGVFSILAEERPDSEDNYEDWVFKSNFYWGEEPKGEWKLYVSDREALDIGVLRSWRLTFYGEGCKKEALTGGEIAGIFFGLLFGLLLLGVLIWVGVVIFRKRSTTSSSTTPVTNTRPTETTYFQVGETVLSQHSSNGQWYRAIIDQFSNNLYLVRYLDFQQTEWRPASALRR